jgi:large repetitive protein
LNYRHIISRIGIVLFLVIALAAPASAGPLPPPIAPIALFTAIGTAGTAPLTVQFTDMSLDGPTGWEWSFGDTGTSTDQNPSHTYMAVGNYTVTLTAINGPAFTTIQKVGYVTVTPTLQPPPQVGGVTPSSAYRNMTVSFVISGSGFVPNYTTAVFRNQSSGILTPMITSVTPVRISGILAIPADTVPGSWNTLVQIEGRGNAIGMNVFQVSNNSSPPQILTIAPSGTWYRNTTVSYSITGSNFETGYTTVSFQNRSGTLLNGSSGAGVTLVSATMINGTIDVPADAPVTPFNVTVTTLDGGTAAKETAFTVAAQPVPGISTITPSGTWSRNTTVTYSISGSNFEPGSTTVSFQNKSGTLLNGSSGAGVTFVSATWINGTIHVPADAFAVTPYNITVTTVDGGRTAKETAFMVAAQPVPGSITITPSGTWYRNTTVNYSITGSNFEAGYTTVSFQNRSGIQLNADTGAGVTFVSATWINGTILVPADASAVTLYNITVTTADGGRTAKEGAITVAAQPVPGGITITPAGTWYRNTMVSYSITGTGFEPGCTVVTFQNRSGLMLGAGVTSVTSTRINGTAVTAPDQPVGPYNITITTIDGGKAVKDAAFTVMLQPAPVITALTPSGTWTYGSTVDYSITGTNFEPATTMVNFQNKSGMSIGSGAISSVTSTRINGTITVFHGMPVGPYNVTVTTPDGGSTVKENVFTIMPQPAPVISSITPPGGIMTTTIPFTLTGSNFETGVGMTMVSVQYEFFPAMIPVTLTSVTPTTITGTLVPPPGNPTGPYDVVVSTGDGGTTVKSGVFVLNTLPAPAVTSITPSSGTVNDGVNFTITGTNFEPPVGGPTTVFFYNPVSMSRMSPRLYTVTSTTITGQLPIPPGTSAGSWDVQVMTADGGTATRPGAFTISAQPNPSPASITPATAPKNSTVSYVIRGTGFSTVIPSIMRLYSPADGSVISGPVSTFNDTVITGTFTIPSSATAGQYRLDILTGLASGSKLDAFTVTSAPAPQVSSVSPATTIRNRTFVLTAAGGNFQLSSGTTAVLSTPSYSTEIPIALINLTPTRFNGTVWIPADAPVGVPWNLNVTTIDGGRSTKASAIAITSYPAPTIGSMNPVTGFRNTTVLFTLTGTNFQTTGGNDTYVWLWNKTSHATIVPTIYSITASQVTGSIAIPADADPAYNINITTIDGGTVMKANAFATAKIPAPSVSSITPNAMYRGITSTFTLQGSNFQNSGRTFVNLTNTSGYSVPATIWNTYTSTITGTVTIPAGTVNGSWSVNVTTLNGGTGSKAGAVSVL